MKTTLDGQALFDDREVTVVVGSPSRAAVERAIAGLNGVLSIDLGQRPRQIHQTGVLRSVSRTAMQARLNSIAAFIDGRTHTLSTADGQVYSNLRVDTFKQLRERTGGPGVVVEYEVVYTQLGD